MPLNHSENPIDFISPLDEKWGSYIESKDDASIFHHPAWINLIAKSYNYRPFIATRQDETGHIQAAIPFVEIKSPLTGKRWVSLSFSDHCAPLYDEQAALDELMAGLSQMYSTKKAPKIELRWDYAQNGESWAQLEQVLHIVELDPDPEIVRAKLHKMHERNIKTAKVRGVEILHGTSQEFLDAFYGMHLETRSRHGVPIQPKKFFNRLRTDVLEKGLGFISLAQKDGEYIAGAVYLHYKNTLVYKYGASWVEYQKLRPNNLIFWEAIEWGCNNGYAQLDMGKTEWENEGLRNFKRGWGAEEHKLIYSVLSDAPPKNGNGFLQTSMEKFINKSPEWVCRATGEILYRHFG
ncbi:GNAT family N-acetyltransferase [bacterium]|nr:GNAT family N-acetyltransferase [bacterium]